MKKLWEKKSYIALGVILLLFVFISYTSLISIRQLQGNARVVNYGGIVRGATQKLIKEELMGWWLAKGDRKFDDSSDWYPDDALVARLDSIVNELITGEGPNGLVVLQDEEYAENMRQVGEHWNLLKGLVMDVRGGAQPDGMFASSQEYFELVNKTVFSAERYSEEQVTRITTTLVTVNIVFVLLIAGGLVIYGRGVAMRRRADTLNKIAYVDPLTGMENRASCEREIQRIANGSADEDIAVVMFDMNDLKLTNDFYGHQGGDVIIAHFANALRKAAEKYGFVGRFGGDEFLAIFESSTKDDAENFLIAVQGIVEDYNKNQTNALEKIKYSAGYCLANPRQKKVEHIIHEADNEMYREKRRIKGL